MWMNLFSIGGFTIHGYGVMIAIGIAMAIVLGIKRAKAYQLDHEVIYDIAMQGVIVGFLGAKLLFVLVNFETFLENPLSVLGGEGFVVYGGIIAGVIAAVLYCRRKKINFMVYLDLLIPSVSLAQAFGRIGCFLSGCCYGRETTSKFGVIFPEGSMAPAGVSLIPTQLISSLGDFVIAGLLIVISKKSKYQGNTGVFYLLFYGIGRFLIEFLRNDDRGTVGFLSTSQFISIFCVFCALIFLVINQKRNVPNVLKK